MIERKKKICKGCLEPKYIYARKMCKQCDYKENHPNKIDRAKKKETGELEFMKELWKDKDHICEECSVFLPEFSPAYISHILSKGCSPSNRLNPANINILCFDCHQKWEFGDKKSMKIFKSNMVIIMELKKEYYNKS